MTLTTVSTQYYYGVTFTGHYGLKCGLHENLSGAACYNMGYTLTSTSFSARASKSYTASWIAVGY